MDLVVNEATGLHVKFPTIKFGLISYGRENRYTARTCQ